jgi:hypothetical protein
LNSEDPVVRESAQMNFLMGYLKIRDSQVQTPVAPINDEDSDENFESNENSEVGGSEEKPDEPEDKNMSISEGEKPKID